MKNNLLWKPSPNRIANTSLFKFIEHVNLNKKMKIKNFNDLHKWSVEHRHDFWDEVWNFYEVIGIKGEKPYLKPNNNLPGTIFFPKGKLNYAENMLKKNNNDIAITFWSEDKIKKKITWSQLKIQVSALVNFLKKKGIKKGDRIAAYLPNIPETIVTMLACSTIGAIFSSASPDFGVEGVVDRFGQIESKILVTTDGYNFNGKEINITDKINKIVKLLPSVNNIILVPLLNSGDQYFSEKVTLYKDLLIHYKSTELNFEKFNLDHPLYIMFSSGTTGKPKCIVHSAGGVLLKHLVEVGLHSNAGDNKNFFYFTTCGWMMWNWLVSSLMLNSNVCLYDGSPFHPNSDILWKYAEQENFNFFGTSAKYIDALSKFKNKISEKFTLKKLETIGSTGSPLVHESFDYVYNHIKKDVHLASLSGGTDIVGCFVGGNPISPVYRGEIQGSILGMDVDVFNDDGQSLVNQQGELVCKKSFPTMPIKFWEDDGTKYHKAYFDKFNNVWNHGDYILKTINNGFIIYGRSDATLNPGGVRIGTAEIYRQVEQIDDVVESLVIGQSWKNDTRLILFVVLREKISLDENLTKKIKNQLRNGASPRHVPALIYQAPQIPKTKSGKIVELAVRDLINGKEIKNVSALANPECLEFYKNLKI
ncbi:MAG: acetoacetate--CoA ligase [Candidatus Endolissoclinum sp. TMED37]|nr:MAG: acetoacetate--CoA ligase [Candidatus Endolissoclinum sp. TMED37]